MQHLIVIKQCSIELTNVMLNDPILESKSINTLHKILQLID